MADRGVHSWNLSVPISGKLKKKRRGTDGIEGFASSRKRDRDRRACLPEIQRPGWPVCVSKESGQRGGAPGGDRPHSTSRNGVRQAPGARAREMGVAHRSRSICSSDLEQMGNSEIIAAITHPEAQPSDPPSSPAARESNRPRAPPPSATARSPLAARQSPQRSVDRSQEPQHSLIKLLWLFQVKKVSAARNHDFS
jgi:hypothetical protein